MVASEPVFSESQLARALIAAASAGIGARILLNKADLPAIAEARERLRPYRELGTPVTELSLKANPDEARAAPRCRCSPARPAWCWGRAAPARAR